ncbi:MAG: MoxR family ATPase [Akkermansiaceae bacterium]|nr:MoxR family ATPase [Armatimonadota bacterium]
MSVPASTAPDPQAIEAQAKAFRDRATRIQSEIARVIVGQTEIVQGVLVAVLAGGHVLLEGVPGLGKTLLVRTLAQVMDLQFSRIQFTPDLMPADITGTTLYMDDEAGHRAFRFMPGPVFSNILLADEINRATPKTQSALLEAMAEKCVTVSGAQRPLPAPFFVLATQNPIEMEGTYPLPEAQMDRFLFKVNVPSPSLAELSAIVERTTGTEVAAADKVITEGEVLEMQAWVRGIVVAPHVRDFAAGLVVASHPAKDNSAPEMVKKYVRVGASPRGAQSLVLAAKVRAALSGRYNVAMDDITAVAANALGHRILLNFEGDAEGINPADVVQSIVAHVSDWQRAAMPKM